MVSSDIVFQYSWDCVRDLQVRVLNAALSTNRAVTSPLSRVIVQPIPPWQLKAQWAGPTLDIDDERVRVSADVSGGVRHVLNGRNLTMRGTVSATCDPRFTVADDGLPVATLVAPSPLDLDLSDLEFTYAGDASAVSWLDAVPEQALLRPTFGGQLMSRLADLPLNYLPASLGRLLKTDRSAALSWAVSIDSDTETLTLAGLRAGSQPAKAPAFVSPDQVANLAVGVSEAGLNSALRRLCRYGPTDPHPSNHVPHSPWTDATATLTGNAIRLRGHPTPASTTAPIDTSVICTITDRGRLQIRLADPDLPRESARTVVDIVTTLVQDVFSTEPARDESTLLQQFNVPGTDVRVTAPLVDLVVRDGYLVARYAVPPTNQPLELAIDDAKPQPIISQDVIPRQSASAAPVTVHLVAILAGSPEPPYDYVWHTAGQPLSHTRHDRTTTITRIPPPSTMEPTQTASLATVDLTVIDVLGRVGAAQIDVQYHPAQGRRPDRPEQRASVRAKRGRGRLALGAALLGLLLAGGVGAVKLSGSRGPMAEPTPSLAPTMPAGGIITSAAPVAPPIATTTTPDRTSAEPVPPPPPSPPPPPPSPPQPPAPPPVQVQELSISSFTFVGWDATATVFVGTTTADSVTLTIVFAGSSVSGQPGSFLPSTRTYVLSGQSKYVINEHVYTSPYSCVTTYVGVQVTTSPFAEGGGPRYAQVITPPC